MPMLHRIISALKPPYGWLHALLAILVITVFWCVFIWRVPMLTYYSVGQIEHFQSMRWWEIFSLVDDGTFARFSPLAFAPIGWFDLHVLVPLLGQEGSPAQALTSGWRTIWLHPLLSAASTAVATLLVWRLFRDRILVASVILLVGLTDTIGFQLYYPPLLGFYLIHICSFLAIYHYVRLGDDTSPRRMRWLVLCTVLPLLIWEQGLDLPIAMSALLFLGLLCQRRAAIPLRRSPEMRMLGWILFFTLLYLVFRVPSGIQEVAPPDRENSYFFSYGNPLPMIDDLLMNISGLVLQAWRQFLPLPPLALSVMANIDMDPLNSYNLKYTEFPNMFYRQMGVWYAGMALAASIALVIYSLRLMLRKQGWERRLLVVSLCVFLFGMTTHLPIMHRDYFYMPGYALGYKICVSYVGFVLLILMMLREALRSRWFTALSARKQAWLLAGGGVYYCLAALSRIVLNLQPHAFPW